VRFIGAAHNGQQEESSHPYFTCVTYFNFALAGQPSVGFFGTDMALEYCSAKIINTFGDNQVGSLHPEFLWLIFYKVVQSRLTQCASSNCRRSKILRENIRDVRDEF